MITIGLPGKVVGFVGSFCAAYAFLIAGLHYSYQVRDRYIERLFLSNQYAQSVESLRVSSKELDRRPHVCHPLRHIDVETFASARPVAVHVDGQRRHASGGEAFAQFAVVLFELSRAMTNDHRRVRPTGLRQVQHA